MSVVFCSGHCYENGIGCDRNLDLSFDYYTLASEQNHHEATLRLLSQQEEMKLVDLNNKSILSTSLAA